MRFLILYVFLLCDKDNIRHTRTCLFSAISYFWDSYSSADKSAVILKVHTDSIQVRFMVVYSVQDQKVDAFMI